MIMSYYGLDCVSQKYTKSQPLSVSQKVTLFGTESLQICSHGEVIGE